MAFVSLGTIFLVSIDNQRNNKIYAKQLHHFISDNYKNNKILLQKIDIENKNFEIHSIRNITINEIIDTNVVYSKNKYTVSNKLFDNHKLYNGDYLIISGNKLFNKLNFVFANHKITKKESLELLNTKFFEGENIFKILDKSDYPLYCKILNKEYKKIKYCKKTHNTKLKNYELTDTVFKNYNHFYFKIDDEFVRFSYE